MDHDNPQYVCIHVYIYIDREREREGNVPPELYNQQTMIM